jgi:plastocyanin
MYRRGWITGALVVATLFLATACSSSSSSATTPSSTSGSAATDVSGQSSTSMSAENFFFSPSDLTGTTGQKLTISLTNDGSVPHNFSITDQNIAVTLQPGDAQDIKVAFPDSGSVQFFCAFHESQGMVGTLQVA